MDVGPSNCDTMGQSGGPNPLIDKIVAELKSQGLFDQLRKECMADVDTKPAYQNLRQRVENTVSDFLHVKKWKPDLAKNKLRDSVRQHMFNMQMLDNGIERIINQAISPKVYSSFVPQVEEVVCSVLGIEKPNKEKKSLSNGVHSSTEFVERKKVLGSVDLLPTDLDPISPEKFDDSDEGGDLVIAKQEDSDQENGPHSENCDADISFDAADGNDSSPLYKPLHGDESPTLNCANDTDPVSADSTMDSFFAVKSVCKTVEESSEADAKNEIMETRSTSSISNDDLMIEESTQMNSPDSVEKDLNSDKFEDDNKKQVDVESSEIEVLEKKEEVVEDFIPDNGIKQEDEKINEKETLTVDKIENKHDENELVVESRSHKSSESSKGKDSSKSQEKTHRSSTKHDTKHSSREKSLADKSSRGHSSSQDRSRTSNREDKKKDDRRSSSSKRDDSKSKSDRSKEDKRRDRSRTDDHKSDSSKKYESKKYSKDSHGEKQRQSDKDRSSNSTHSHRSEKRSDKCNKSEDKSKDNESSTSSSASPSQDSVNQKSHSTQDKSESRHKNKDQDSSKTEKNGRDSKKSDDKYKNKTRDSEMAPKESNIDAEQHLEMENNPSESLDIFEDAEVIDFNDVNENSKLKLIEYEENKFKRPKIAENFHEIRKIMRLRKNLNRLDKLKQKRLLSEDVKLEEQQKPSKEEEQPNPRNEEHESEDRAAKRLVIDDSKHHPEISEKTSITVSGPSVQESKDEILFFENSKSIANKTLQDVLLEGDVDSCGSSNDCADTSDGSDDDSLVSLEFNEVDYTALVLDHPEFLAKRSSQTIHAHQQQAEDKPQLSDVKSTAQVSIKSSTFQPESPYQGDPLAKENKDSADFVKDETPIVKKGATKKRQQSFDCSKQKAKPQVPEKRFMLNPPKETKNINHIEKEQVFDDEETNSQDSIDSMPDEQNEITANGHEDSCKSPPEANPSSPPSFPAKPLQPLQQGQEETDSEKQTLSQGRPKRVQTTRGVSAKQQRYDSSDLYKPRLSFASTRRLRESTTAAASGRNARNVVHTPERK